MSVPNIVAPGPLAASSQIVGYDKSLRARATLKDIYVNLQGLYKRTEQQIPPGIYMQVDKSAESQSNRVTITMQLPLKGDPILADNTIAGNEETPETKSAVIYRYQYAKTVGVYEFGVNKLDQEPYGIYRNQIKGLGLWAQQFEGLEIRQAFVETNSITLQQGLPSKCPSRFNPHIYVQGALDIDQPKRGLPGSTQELDYINAISAAIVSAGGPAHTDNQAATFRMFNKVAEKALDLKLLPLNIGGNDSFLMTISTRTAAIMNDPAFGVGTSSFGWGAAWTPARQFQNKEVQMWYGILGSFRTAIGCDIYVTVDPKLPSLILGGTAAPYSLSPGYVWPGDIDRRQLSNPNTRDISILHATGGACKWDAEPLHFIKQDEDYFRKMGHGIAGVRGIQQVQFESDDPLTTDTEYYGSMLVIMDRPNY
jgi:hypothetical protein